MTVKHLRLPSDRAVHPLRLEILPGTLAAHVDRLVLLEGGPEDGFVQARDLATGAPLRVRLEDLRAQLSVVESELNRRMELAHERSDGEWQRALDNFALLQQLLDDKNGTLDQRVHKAAAARSVAPRTIYRSPERFRRIAQLSSLLGFRPGPPHPGGRCGALWWAYALMAQGHPGSVPLTFTDTIL